MDWGLIWVHDYHPLGPAEREPAMDTATCDAYARRCLGCGKTFREWRLDAERAQTKYWIHPEWEREIQRRISARESGRRDRPVTDGDWPSGRVGVW